MLLCDDDHEEVCFSDEVDCPVCEINTLVDGLNRQVMRLKTDLKEAQSKD